MSMGSKKTILKRTTAYVLAFVMAFSLLFTGNNAVTASAAAKTVKSIKVAKSKVTLDAGKKKTAKVKVTVKGANKKFSVKSTNDSVATAKVKGKNVVITAVAKGTATIKVTTKGKKKGKKLTKKIKVTVNGDDTPVVVTAVSVAVNPASIKVGETAQATATATPAGVATTFTYTSGNANVATVDATGKITGVAAGTADITATSANGVSGKATITVTANGSTDNPNVATKITPSIPAGNNTINVGGETKISVDVTPATAASSLVYSSSDESVVTVDKEGRVVAQGPGTATITVSSPGGVSQTITITVAAVPVTGVSLSASTIKLAESGSSELTYTVIPDNATNRNVEWSTTNEKVATVKDGVVKAVAAGTADIIVKTVDGGFTAKCTVTVSPNTSDVASGIDVKVTNSLEGYPNTVLVGENAEIEVSVKTGVGDAAAGNRKVDYTLDFVENSGRDVYVLSEDTGKTGDNGKTTFTVKLDKDASKYKALVSDLDNVDELAFASYNLTVKTTGLEDKVIPVKFAQYVAATDKSVNYYNRQRPEAVALSVDNWYDDTLPVLAPSNRNGFESVQTVRNEEDYYTQYVVDQQYTENVENAEDHTIVLDAAPLIILPLSTESETKNSYSKNNITGAAIKEYSVYQDVIDAPKACTLENVPGGLDYLTLTFKSLQLSPYTQIVVRAYQAGTDIPLAGNIQTVITSDTTISSTTQGSAISIKKDIFGRTKDVERIDLKIFVESAGQVSEDENKGFELVSAEGKATTNLQNSMEVKRLASAVNWEVLNLGKDGYNGETVLTEDEAINYIGSANYNEDAKTGNMTYKISCPSAPRVGDAIIKGYNSNDSENAKVYYLYPTKLSGNTSEPVATSAYRIYAVPGNVEVNQELKESDLQIQKDAGRLKVNSLKSGYVYLRANVNISEDYSYELYSAIYWTPKPIDEVVDVEETYAVANQNVEVVATIKAANGGIPAKGTKVNWFSGDDDVKTTDAVVTTNEYTYGTDSEGKVSIVLSSPKNFTLSDLNVVPNGNYVVTELTVGGQKIKSQHADITWVEPNLYFKDSVDGSEYYSSDYNKDDPDVEYPRSQYVVGSNWIVGTKVVGPRPKDGATKRITNISNIEILMTPTEGEAKMVFPTETYDKKGVANITSTAKGESSIDAQLGGILDPTKPCVITVEEDVVETDEEGKQIVTTLTKTYNSVGKELNNEVNVTMKLNFLWVPNEANLKAVNYNPIFSTSNTEPAYFYAQVTGEEGVAQVDGLEVKYEVVDGDGNIVGNLKGTKKLQNGFIAVQLPTDLEDDTYTISYNITGKDVIDKIKINTVNENTKPFAVESCTPDIDNNKITLKLSNIINLSVASKLTKDYFELTDESGNKIDIKSASVSATSGDTIVIEANSAITSKVVVNVKPKYTEEATGCVHYLLDSEGQILKAYTNAQN